MQISLQKENQVHCPQQQLLKPHPSLSHSFHTHQGSSLTPLKNLPTLQVSTSSFSSSLFLNNLLCVWLQIWSSQKKPFLTQKEALSSTGKSGCIG